jgi:hypothetical protein
MVVARIVTRAKEGGYWWGRIGFQKFAS